MLTLLSNLASYFRFTPSAGSGQAPIFAPQQAQNEQKNRHC